MAFSISVFKVGPEDEYFVYYIYKFLTQGEEYKSASGKTRYKPKEVSVKLKIDKRNGNVHIIELAERDNGMHAERASWAFMKHWKKGEFPEGLLAILVY